MKARKRAKLPPLFTTLFLLISATIYAQETDSAQLYYDQGKSFFEKAEYEKAASAYRKGLNSVDSAIGSSLNSDTNNDLGYCFYYLSKHDSALKYFLFAFKIDEANHDMKRMSGRKRNIGSAFRRKGLFASSLKALLEAKQYAEIIADHLQLASALNSIGNLYLDQNSNQDAQINFAEAYRLNSMLNDTLRLASTSNNLANAYFKLEAFDSALLYYHKSLALKGAKGSLNSLAITLNNMGETWLALHSFDSAYHYFNRAYALRQTTGNRIGIAKSSLGLAHASLLNNDVLSSRRFLNDAKLIAQDVTSRSLNLDVLNAEISLAEFLKQYRSANTLLKQWAALRDSIFNSERLSVQKIEADFLLNIEQQSRESAERENTNLRTQTQTRLWLLLLSALLITTLLVAGLLILRSKRSLQQSENRIKKLHKEGYHRMGNNLQLLMTIFNSQVKSTKGTREEAAVRDATNRFKSVTAIHQMLDQNQKHSRVRLDNYLQSLTENVLLSFENNTKVKTVMDLQLLSVEADQAVQIGLITNETLTNALKYAFQDTLEPVLSISLTNVGTNSWELRIADNGPGIAKQLEAGKRGFGTQFILDTAEDMNAQIDIYNRNGTIYVLKFTPLDKTTQ